MILYLVNLGLKWFLTQNTFISVVGRARHFAVETIERYAAVRASEGIGQSCQYGQVYTGALDAICGQRSRS